MNETIVINDERNDERNYSAWHINLYGYIRIWKETTKGNNMYIDSYEIVTIGTKYEGNKEKKNQVLTHVHSDDGIVLKRLFELIDTYDDTVMYNNRGKCKITVEFEQGE